MMAETHNNRGFDANGPARPDATDPCTSNRKYQKERHGTVRSRRTPRARLALFDGRPAFSDALHVGRPNMPDSAAYLARIETMLQSGWLSNGGPMVREFETTVARISGAKHCVATCNGTLALELAIGALGLSGEVIVPSFTFVATVHALTRMGLTPVFCDIDPATHCLDPRQVEGAITAKTSGILAVTLWGNPCDEVELRRLADQHGLSLLFDSAHAFGCDLGRSSGARLCELEVYSFHATKCIQALEGGAIVTDDDELAERLRQMVNFGFSGEDRVDLLGTNAKMNEAAAAMGLCSIEQRRRIFHQNRENHLTYRAGVKHLPGISMAAKPLGERHNYQYVVLDFDAEAAGLSRDQFIAALRAENILARRYFYPGVHRMAPYRDRPDSLRHSLAETERVARRTLVMPSGLSVTRQDVYRICDTMGAILNRAGDVAATLPDGDPRLPPVL